MIIGFPKLRQLLVGVDDIHSEETVKTLLLNKMEAAVTQGVFHQLAFAEFHCGDVNNFKVVNLFAPKRVDSG